MTRCLTSRQTSFSETWRTYITVHVCQLLHTKESVETNETEQENRSENNTGNDVLT